MKDSNHFPPHLTLVIKEMCKSVKAPYTKISFHADNWWESYSWSQKKEDNFVIWLAQYLKSSKEARKELLRSFGVKNCEKAAKEFVSNFGWKVK